MRDRFGRYKCQIGYADSKDAFIITDYKDRSEKYQIMNTDKFGKDLGRMFNLYPVKVSE